MFHAGSPLPTMSASPNCGISPTNQCLSPPPKPGLLCLHKNARVVRPHLHNRATQLSLKRNNYKWDLLQTGMIHSCKQVRFLLTCIAEIEGQEQEADDRQHNLLPARQSVVKGHFSHSFPAEKRTSTKNNFTVNILTWQMLFSCLFYIAPSKCMAFQRETRIGLCPEEHPIYNL